jgi:hypothetical protein
MEQIMKTMQENEDNLSVEKETQRLEEQLMEAFPDALIVVVVVFGKQTERGFHGMVKAGTQTTLFLQFAVAIQTDPDGFSKFTRRWDFARRVE